MSRAVMPLRVSGLLFDYLEPTVDMIDHRDIAMGLSKDCRYAGQCDGFYSVAQHSVLGAISIDEEYALEFMLHDGAEYVCRDVTSPFKRTLPDYQAAEARIDRVIRLKYGLPLEMSPAVKAMDDALYYAERRDLCPGYKVEEWDDKLYRDEKALQLQIVPMEWNMARMEWLSFFHYLTNGKYKHADE